MLTPKKSSATKMAPLFLTLILIVQLVMMVYFGVQKAGYHVDEMFTYTLSNFSETFVSRVGGFSEQWVDGQTLYDTLSVDDDERFNYRMTYHNQEEDVHPPLYYFVIHTISSVFEGTFSKWIGIAPNIIFCMLTTIVLYFISKKISGNIQLALLIVLTWGLSIGAMSSAVFIRMYAMLTFFSSLLALLHLNALDETLKTGKISCKTYVFLGVCTVLGILTQYYFMVFCFFLCGCFFFYLLTSKKWASLMRYVLVEFGAIAVSFVCFPKMIDHIFSGYRGKEAFSNLSQSNQDVEKVKKVLSIISHQLFNGWAKLLVIILVLIALYLFITRVILKITVAPGKENITLKIEVRCSRQFVIDLSKENLLIIAAMTVSLGYIFVVTKIAPYQTDRYYMCIYPILTLSVVGIFYKIVGSMLRTANVVLIVVAVFCTLSVGLSHKTETVNYLYLNHGQRTEELEDYSDFPVIMLNNQYENALDLWLWECRNYSAVYRCKSKNIGGITNAVNSRDLSNGFLIMAYGYSETEEELFQKLGEYTNIGSHELITKVGCPVYFCTLGE